MPPVTLTKVPVMPAAWSEARKTAVAATSARVGLRRVMRIPARPSTMPWTAFSSMAGLTAESFSTLNVSGIPAAFSSLKVAEDGKGLVFRIYEPAGRRGSFALEASGWSTAPVTILEEPQKRDAELDLLPFELRSWRLTKV